MITTDQRGMKPQNTLNTQKGSRVFFFSVSSVCSVVEKDTTTGEFIQVDVDATDNMLVRTSGSGLHICQIDQISQKRQISS